MPRPLYEKSKAPTSRFIGHRKKKETPPKNLGKGPKLRRLDCAVINFLHTLRTEKGLPEYNTVRADFWEGEEIYPAAGFREQDMSRFASATPLRF